MAADSVVWFSNRAGSCCLLDGDSCAGGRVIGVLFVGGVSDDGAVIWYHTGICQAVEGGSGEFVTIGFRHVVDGCGWFELSRVSACPVVTFWSW